MASPLPQEDQPTPAAPGSGSAPPPLAALTTLRVGGPARRVVEATTTEALVEAVRAADAAGEPVLVLGGGSNVLVADAGFPGTVVRVLTRGLRVDPDGHVTAQAGEPWDSLVARAVDAGLAGIEALSGIPGLTGATPVQNVGAYGQEVAQTIETVDIYDRRERRERTLANAECGFGYRTSVFKGTDRFVVLSVRFALEPSPLSRPIGYTELARRLGVQVGDRVPLGAVRAAVLALRAAKGMVLDPADPDTFSAGSFFTNPVLDPAAAEGLPRDAPRWPRPDGSVKVSAAWLIEQAGFGRGFGAEVGHGRARLSSKHALALTNHDHANARDLLALARLVRDGVRARFGISLRAEPVLVGCSLGKQGQRPDAE